MRQTVLDKVIEYLKEDKQNGNLEAQAYAEQLLFWIDNWIEDDGQKQSHDKIEFEVMEHGLVKIKTEE
tara:strand:+ start:51 stop:254 length:204 start_codon:yes stop_codon:yes gene_type:complete